MNPFATAIVAVAFTFGSTWTAGAQAPASADAKALFQSKCSLCHPASRAEGKKKSREEWEATVARMVKKGAALNDQEAKLVADYLAKHHGP